MYIFLHFIAYLLYANTINLSFALLITLYIKICSVVYYNMSIVVSARKKSQRISKYVLKYNKILYQYDKNRGDTSPHIGNHVMCLFYNILLSYMTCLNIEILTYNHCDIINSVVYFQAHACLPYLR